jgi:hypothetical protein
MDRVFIALSFLGGLAAVGFWYKGHFTSMVVAATLGAVCWLLNYRVQMRRIVDEADAERNARFETGEDDD